MTVTDNQPGKRTSLHERARQQLRCTACGETFERRELVPVCILKGVTTGPPEDCYPSEYTYNCPHCLADAEDCAEEAESDACA